ncbi:hypothetical protein CON64_06310 [Bacillus pseudomycoides]|nr:hypothetical protein CON64_06310 [Bacillus pseudomycoides]
MLTLKNVSKTFNNEQVLKNINAEFSHGLNFIVGPSGSGKTTLLKIISGMDPEFEGEVYFNNKSIKQFSKSERNDYYYNSIGFIWQNFQLINHLSVEDNIMVVLELSNLDKETKSQKVKNTLQKLGISRLAKQNVKSLSGGEKQRVAIARALVNDPEIIIADEPTGALDKKNAKEFINVLKQIAKERMVIVVTHDQSIIDELSSTYVLKSGEIIQERKQEASTRKSKQMKKNAPSFSFNSGLTQGFKNIKGMVLKTILTAIVLLFSSYFVLINVSGNISNQGKEITDNLVKQYGQSLFNISIFPETMEAGSTSEGAGGNGANSQNKDVKQDISSIFKDYKNDERVKMIYPLLTLNNMAVSIDGVINQHKVEQSNYAPANNGLVAGRMPNNDKEEVAVTKAFLDKINVSPEKALDKEIEITGSMVDGDQSAVLEGKSHTMKLKIVGVINSKMEMDKSITGGEATSIELEDAFIYSKKAVEEFYLAFGKDTNKIPFELRATSLPNVLSLVKELQGKGIVPFGQFMMVKNISDLNATTDNQSSSITGVMGILALIITITITIVNTFVRKNEYALLKINGFSFGSITKLTIIENILTSAMALVLFFAALPLLNKFSTEMFSSSLTNQHSIILFILIIVIQGLLMGIIASLLAGQVQPIKALQSGGDR